MTAAVMVAVATAKQNTELTAESDIGVWISYLFVYFILYSLLYQW